MKNDVTFLFRTRLRLTQTFVGSAVVALLALIPSTKCWAAFNDANWISMGGYAGTHGGINYGPPIGMRPGFVYAAAFDNSGNLYIGGSFDIVGELFASSIAKWNGSSWSKLGSGVNGEVRAIVATGGDVYVGGNFSMAGGVAANNIAKWDGNSWSALGSGIPTNNAPTLFTTVFSLAVMGPDLYVGGRFTNAGGVSAKSIAKWNGSNWSALGNGMGTNSPIVFALAVSGTTLYAGGDFREDKGAPADAIAQWNGSSWSSLGWEPVYPGGIVQALTMMGNELIVGGGFSVYDDSVQLVARNLAKWNGSSWAALNPALKTGAPSVISLAVSGNTLYLGGGFNGRVVSWNGGSGFSTLGSGVTNGVGGGGTVYALAVSGTNLCVGGNFKRAGGTTAENIALWNGTDWSSFGLVGGLNERVESMAIWGGDLYVGGSFTNIGNLGVTGLARWNGTNWSAVNTGLWFDVLSFGSYAGNYQVSAMTVVGNDLYVAKRGYVIKWDGTNWTTVGSEVLDAINALAVVGGNLYYGGNEGAFRWNGSSWSRLDGIGAVNALAVLGNNLYAGGYFTTADGSVADRIAKWNGSNWSSLGSGLNAGVVALTISGSDLYAGGDFTMAGGMPANYVAKWNGSSWSAIDAGPDRSVTALATSGTDLFAALGPNVLSPQPTIVKWDGESWSPLGTGVNYLVNALAVSGNELFVGGSFAVAGGKVSANLARATIPGARGRFSNLVYSTATGFSCVFSDGSLDQPYRIQTSPSLSPGSWTDFTNFTYTLPVAITDSPVVSGTNKFFRAVTP